MIDVADFLADIDVNPDGHWSLLAELVVIAERLDHSAV